MLFMVIETFNDQDIVPVYERFRDAGRALPTGLTFVDSWVETTFGRCFQLMSCDDASLLQAWVLNWRGTGTTFEIVPVVPSAETRSLVDRYIDDTSR